MKNVTIAIDDEVHRRARIHAAQMGTSLSALVKTYLQSIGGADSYPLPSTDLVPAKVHEMPMPFHAQPATAQPATAPLGAPSLPAMSAGKGPDGQPYCVNGKWVFTKDGKPRKPGAMRHFEDGAVDFDNWPVGVLESLDAWPYDDPGFDPLPFNDGQLPRT